MKLGQEREIGGTREIGKFFRLNSCFAARYFLAEKGY